MRLAVVLKEGNEFNSVEVADGGEKEDLIRVYMDMVARIDTLINQEVIKTAPGGKINPPDKLKNLIDESNKYYNMLLGDWGISVQEIDQAFGGIV